MQVNQPKSSTPEATTPRYDTIVIRGAQGSAVPKEVDGGEVISWSRGHELAGMNALEEFVEDLAAGGDPYPTLITERAQKALDLMKLRRVHGWDAEAALLRAAEQECLECSDVPFGPGDECDTARIESSEPINYGELDPVQRLAVCRGTPLPVAADGRKDGVSDHV